MDLLFLVKTNLKNIPGKILPKRLVILECDDWGGIRMPSKEIYEKLLNARVPLENTRFNTDTLEDAQDLERLFEVLQSVKDYYGNNAIMTPFTVVANPDFEKIKKSGFTYYYFEKFTDTLIRYGRSEKVLDLWKKGIEAGIFLPELHGRDHLAVDAWLRKLREGDKNLLLSFENGFTSLVLPNLDPQLQGFRAEYYFESLDQISFLKESIRDSVIFFKEIFGYQPVVFVPGNAVFNPLFEEELVNTGIKFLYMNRISTYKNNEGRSVRRKYISGHKSLEGLVYYTRNCSFEPSESDYKGIEKTMVQIAAAFRWNKPAIISTHRVNFAGGINPSCRVNGLTELKKLLRTIVKKWPDIEFANSAKGLSYLN